MNARHISELAEKCMKEGHSVKIKQKTVYDREKMKVYAEHFARRLNDYGYFPKDKESFGTLANFMGHYYENINRKSILIYGDTGRGKTFFMEIMARINKIPLYHIRELVGMYQDDPGKSKPNFRKFLHQKHSPICDGKERDIIIDDVGDETIVSEWGIKDEVFNVIIQERYDAFKKKGAMTLITSNLPIVKPVNKDVESIQSRYGDRTKSRLTEMCSVIELKCGDNRINTGV